MTVEVASISTKNYGEVIEIRVPAWENDMINQCLDALSPAIVRDLREGE